MEQKPLGTLPEAVRYQLLAAATGKHHLTATAQAALNAASEEPGPAPNAAPVLLALAKELCTAAWLTDPLDGARAAEVIELERRLPGLCTAGAKCVAVAARFCAAPGDGVPSRLSNLMQAGDYPALRTWLEAQLKRSPGNGFLTWNLFHQALVNGDEARALDVASSLAAIPALAPAAAKLTADARFLAGDFVGAAAAYEQVELFFPGLCADRAGEALWRAGRREQGLERLRQAVLRSPWMVNAALRLHDLSTGLDAVRGDLPGKVAVLLYSYNNADKLDRTLASLHASLPKTGADILVRVLCNGSTDSTAAVIERWQGRFGPAFAGVLLPVNVGAAPARNWLSSLPEVAVTDFVVYLDDDVRLPEDWLLLFGAAVAARPGAGLWGCRVTDYQKKANLQSVDLNLLPPRQGEPLFSMTDAQLSAFDFGQFSYLRPATSVTGCCHLFRTKTLLQSGGFDIRFSPTQFDDLDHDLRLGAAGVEVIYQGHLAVEHMKISGRGLRATPVAAANAAANMHKLKSKFVEKDMLALRARALLALETDLAEKLGRLDLKG